MEIFVTIVAVAAVVGFVYWRIQKSKEDNSTGSGVGGGRPSDGTDNVNEH